MSARHGRDEEPDTIEGLRAQRDQLAAELVAARREVARMSAGFAATAGDQTGPIARVQGPRTTGHRAPRVPKEARWLRVVPGFVPVLGALKYAWHAHRVATAITGSVLTAAAATTTAAVVAPHGSIAQVLGVGSLPASTLGPAWQTTGIPIPSLAPSARPGLDAKSSRKNRLPALVPPPPAPSVSLPPSVPVLPSPSPSHAVPLLTLSAGTLNLGVYVTGSVTVGNPRQDQAVSWSVSCGADVTPLPAFGVLMPGQQGVQIQVQVNPIDGMSGGLCVFSPGNERLVVSWAGAGAPSAGL